MSEFAMLAAALAFVALLCVALGIVCKGLYRNQQRLLVEQAKRDDDAGADVAGVDEVGGGGDGPQPDGAGGRHRRADQAARGQR